MDFHRQHLLLPESAGPGGMRPEKLPLLPWGHLARLHRYVYTDLHAVQ